MLLPKWHPVELTSHADCYLLSSTWTYIFYPNKGFVPLYSELILLYSGDPYSPEASLIHLFKYRQQNAKKNPPRKLQKYFWTEISKDELKDSNLLWNVIIRQIINKRTTLTEYIEILFWFNFIHKFIWLTIQLKYCF